MRGVRVLGYISSEDFAKELLSLGERKFPTKSASDLISVPFYFCVSVPSLNELIRHVFPDISNKYKNHPWLSERAILAPEKENVNKINESIFKKLPGNSVTYKFVDAEMDKEQAVFYQTEFLNSLNPPLMPPHILNQKVGSSIMLLRNLDNKTYAMGQDLSIANVIQATTLRGNNKGESVFIPRIPLFPSDMPFEFKDIQFPVCLAFAITISKTQGNSLKDASINLETHASLTVNYIVQVLKWELQENLTYILRTARLKMSFILKL
ncbi:hypothetical protein AVEN_62584-1 [Araneus ventricosus]|uniref:DNA helicase Pif1-like 2B domain-containing protein n=1 Tax=Araneus ventricosus TaxID=182803 RepID=A0A4Y2U8V6_ARAVE|nr:hypothetical protein AVEN_256631-1 [Araneus ventricosus]GBO09079.1 hypothetical protein AVEN_62584-1 [Araneus ventricosus]